MILTPDCLVCTQRVALESARFVTQDENLLSEVVYRMMEVLKAAVSRNADSFLIGLKTMEIIKEVTGCDDPYKDFKERAAHIAKSLIPHIREAIAKSSRPLLTACYAAVLGNNLDVVGNGSHERVNETILDQLSFAVNHFEKLRSVLKRAVKVVYLADNAGEVFFDRIFMESILSMRERVEIVYFVKDFPFLSDAQCEDIVDARIGEIATVKAIHRIDSIEMDQTCLSRLFKSFLEEARKADLVIAKGQANFEVLPNMLPGVFYLFMHKCPTIARHEGASVGEAAIYRK